MKKRFLAALIAGCALGSGTAFADEAYQDRKIGYTIVGKNWAIYQTPDGKAECPNGLNDGPREQFDKLYPREGHHKFAASQLEREGEVWLPDSKGDDRGLPFYEPQGKIGIGLDLDGKNDAGDFTSADGKVAGIDNQIYRVFGCVGNYRGPDGSYRFFIQEYMKKFNYNRMLIEIADLDDMVNDPDVTVTVLRGRDALLLDSQGAFAAGGTQRVDMRWGKDLIKSTKGRVVDGVLTTDPIDITMPESLKRGSANLLIHDWRVQLRLTEEGAEGLMGGYLDIEKLYNNLAQNWTTHYRSYGREPLPSEYRAMIRNADAYPDASGRNTAISSGWEVKFKQVFIVHPPQAVASGTPATGGASVPARQ
ncbi:MAG: hypothetical protein IT566_00530 [Rhodospirillaceae bacterium]|nr:hypothetical protein [Rhodospirillaceae bacterium]